MTVHPSDVLQGYRIGSRQAVVELQQAEYPAIHIDFKVLGLIHDIQQRPGQAVILTGTAGDGKTYLAYQLVEHLGLDKAVVLKAQHLGGYDQDGVYIDLDLSAGALTDERVRRLHTVLTTPGRLTLVCANEGKLNELIERFTPSTIPPRVIVINLSRRAIISPEAWNQVLQGVLNGRLWQTPLQANELVAWNRNSLQDPQIAERVRRYLLLPYLLGEPITVRETLSFLAYALGSGLSAAQSSRISPGLRIRHLLFNTLFSEPEGYEHGGRATPSEKLLYWLYRFDPADQASPEIDLKLLVELDQLDVVPPPDLLEMWRNDLLVRGNEQTDTEYRVRLARYMRYARRWYALASDIGFVAYFPFRHFADYLSALHAPHDDTDEQVGIIIRGLNVLLSGGREDD
ncbi:MAG: hypothetical protein CYG59_19495, partial [Chloroflexi bacterium]